MQPTEAPLPGPRRSPGFATEPAEHHLSHDAPAFAVAAAASGMALVAAVVRLRAREPDPAPGGKPVSRARRDGPHAMSGTSSRLRRVIAGCSLQSPPGDVSHGKGRYPAELIQPGAQPVNALDRDEAAEGRRPQVDVSPGLHRPAERRDALTRPQRAEDARCQERTVPVRVTQRPDQAADPGQAGRRFNRFAADIARSAGMVVNGVTVKAPEHETETPGYYGST